MHIIIHTCKMQILLPLGGHAHLAEPGCLCTKQALGACASKLLENGLGTRKRNSYLLTAWVWAPKVPPGPLLLSEKEPHPSLRQVPIHSWVVGMVGGRERRLDNIHLRVVGLEPPRPKPFHHQATHAHT